MVRSSLLVLLLAGLPACRCGSEAQSDTRAATRDTRVVARSPASILDEAAARGGAALIVGSDKGIEARTPDGQLVAVLVHTPARFLRLHRSGETRALYFLVVGKRKLARLDLTTGKQAVVASLPRSSNACFADRRGNPFLHIRGADDVEINAERGFACIDAAAQSGTDALTLNVHVDLKSGVVRSAVVVAAGRCTETTAARLCSPQRRPSPAVRQPARPPAHSPDSVGLKQTVASPSGRWFSAALQAGEDLFLAVFDGDTGRMLTVREQGLVNDDYRQLRQAGFAGLRRDNPGCRIASPSFVEWLPRRDRDVLLAPCGPHSMVLVRPPTGFVSLTGASAVIY